MENCNTSDISELGKGHRNTTNIETIQKSVVNGVKSISSHVAAYFGTGNVGNDIYNRAGDTFNNISNTKNGDSIDNSRNTAFIGADCSSFLRGFSHQASKIPESTADVESTIGESAVLTQSKSKDKRNPESMDTDTGAIHVQTSDDRKQPSNPDINVNGDHIEDDALIIETMDDCTDTLEDPGMVRPEYLISKATTNGGTESGAKLFQADSLILNVQPVTVKLKLGRCAEDEIVLKMPAHLIPLITLVQTEDGTYSVSIACPGCELSVYAISDILYENGSLSPTLTLNSSTFDMTSDKGAQEFEGSDPMRGSHVAGCCHLATDKAVEVPTELSYINDGMIYAPLEPRDIAWAGKREDEKGEKSKKESETFLYSRPIDHIKVRDNVEYGAAEETERALEAVLDVVNPTYKSLYDLYERTQYEDIMSTDTFYVVKGGNQTGIFRSSIHAGKCEANDPGSSTTTTTGLKSALEHGIKVFFSSSSVASGPIIEEVSDPISLLTFSKMIYQGVAMACQLFADI